MEAKCLNQNTIMKYPTPEDRELMPAIQVTAQKSEEVHGPMGGAMNIESNRSTFKTDSKDAKGKTSPQPRKLQKQTSLKSFHTFDPEGSQKRL